MRRLSNSLMRGRGATATETVILILLVAMVVLASVKALQGTLGNKVELANTEVAAVSTEDADEQRRRKNIKRVRNEGAAGSGKTASAAQGTKGEQVDGAEGNGASAAGSVAVDKSGGPGPRGAAPGAGSGAQPESGCGGFNPFLIPIALGLFGLLGYVVMKSQKG